MFNPRFIGILKHPGYNGGDGGGGSAPAPTQSNVVNTNIPEYAQPYVENMLGATQEQLFNVNPDGSLGSLKPYTPYSTTMSDYVAGFSPLQKTAQTKAAGLTLPGQFGAGTALAGASGSGSLGTAATASGAGADYARMAKSPSELSAYMNPYISDILKPQLAEAARQYGITGAQEQSRATAANAFGGSREALMAAENERNKNTAMNQIIGQGYNTAYQQALGQQQFGANLGLQGQQTALTGLGQAGQAGATLGQLGSSELGAQQGIINAQNQIGQQQQAQEQQKVNQAIQNYATAQQYPLMELGTMSNMLRGLPMQASTTQQYQAAPSALTQGIGIAGALGSLGQSGIFGGAKKEGGMVNSYAEGGIASYDVGGAVKADLERMPTEKLQQLMSSAKGIELSQIKQILNDRAQGAMQDFAPGGIVAFAKGEVVNGPDFSIPEEEPTSFLGRNIGTPLKKWAEKEKAQMMADDAVEKYKLEKGVMPWTAQTKAQIADYEKGLADVKRQRDSAYSNGPGGYVEPDAKPAPAANPTVDPNAPPAPPSAKPAVDPNAPPAPAAKPKSIVDPNKSILNNAQAAENPAFSVANMEKYAENQKKIGAQEYIDQVKNAPMSEEGQKLYDSYKDKVDNAKTKEEQRFWMHSALFFARLGSTPGSVGVAALSALKDQLPEYIKDKDALEEYDAKTRKAMYEISNAEMLKRQGHFEAGEKAKNEALKNYINFYDKEADIKWKDIHGKNEAISVRNKGSGSPLAQERLDEKTETDIQKAIKDRTKNLEEKLNIARLGTGPKSQAKVTDFEAQIKKIEDDIRANYKKQNLGSPTSAPKGTNAKDPLNLGI